MKDGKRKQKCCDGRKEELESEVQGRERKEWFSFWERKGKGKGGKAGFEEPL